MIDPQQLLATARQLAATKGRGRPRSANLRRSISTSYYALFHHLLRAAADLLIGAVERDTQRHNLAYRALDHGRMKGVCTEVLKSPAARGFGMEVVSCARLFVELQDSRQTADYDPSATITIDHAHAAVNKAEKAMRDFAAAPELQRRLFLTLLHFRPRP
jgi:uncharacterized protein (UPF0332 family)